MLHVVMYHYVRDPAKAAFPRLKAMPLDAFRQQVCELARSYEMATLDSAIDFLEGRYGPRRDLCLLTFDDGLADHYFEVMPILAAEGVQGLFFVVTACIEEHRMAAAHVNHLLMASLPEVEYQRQFYSRMSERVAIAEVDRNAAVRAYPWDNADTACFKYFFNFLAPMPARDAVTAEIFRANLGDESSMARAFYLNWRQARQMQDAGMVLGGHTHWHRPLSSMGAQDLADDLEHCRRLLDLRLQPQPLWPFSYPYGKAGSFTDDSVRVVQRAGFDCAFTTEGGPNRVGADVFRLRRVDCKKAPSSHAELASRANA